MATWNIPIPPFARDPDIGCKDADPDVFYPPTYRAGSVALAVSICAACPLQSVCRGWALSVGEPEGVWGGLTPDERRVLRRRYGL